MMFLDPVESLKWVGYMAHGEVDVLHTAVCAGGSSRKLCMSKPLQVYQLAICITLLS